MARDAADNRPGVSPSPEDIHRAMARTRAELADRLHSLKRHLFGTKAQALSTGDETIMPTPKRARTKTAARSKTAGGASRTGDAPSKARSRQDDSGSRKASGGKGAAKASAGGKSVKAGGESKRKPSSAKGRSGGSAKGKSASRAKKSGSSRTRSKVAEAVGEVLAGAAVGAVTSAAARVGDQPTSTLQLVDSPGQAPQVGGGAPPSEVMTDMASGAAVGALAGAAKAMLPEAKPRPRGKGASPRK